MTISSTTRVAGPFTGNGTVATFPFTFKVFDVADLYVVSLNVATGAITVLALTTDFTATLNTDQDSTPGGSITLTAGNLATGYTLTITTDMAQLQGLDLTNGGGFYPDVINAALDTLTILVQQLQQQVNRCLQLPVSDAGTSAQLPPATQRIGLVLAFDSHGAPTVALIPSGSGAGGMTVYDLTLTADLAPSLAATPSVGSLVQFIISQDGVGGHNFTWPATIKNPPTVDPAASSTTTALFVMRADGFLYPILGWQ